MTMAYMLTINRIMGLAAFQFDNDDADRPEGSSLAQIFRKQMRVMSDDLGPIYKAIENDLADKSGHEVELIEDRGGSAEQDISIFRKALASAESEDAAPASSPDLEAPDG